MTWKGIKPVVHVLEKVYETGVFLTKKELKPYLSKLKRSLNLHKCDICMNSINGLNICFGFPNHSISGYPLTCTLLRKGFRGFIIIATWSQRHALQRFTSVWAQTSSFFRSLKPLFLLQTTWLSFFGHPWFWSIHSHLSGPELAFHQLVVARTGHTIKLLYM